MLKLPYKVAQVEDDAIPLQLQPGLLSIVSDRDASGRWKDGNLVRFTPSSGLPAKIGGWTQVIPNNLTGGNFTGAGRTVHEWQSLDRQLWLAVGTNCKLYVYNQGLAYDITPSRRFATLTNPFATTNLSPTVTVTDPNHSANVGDHIQLTGFSAVGGLTLSGEYSVVSTTLNTYTITAASNATSTVAAGGGTGTINYDISCMSADASQMLGWGAGTWSQAGTTWGTPRPSSNIFSDVGYWSLGNWGEDLIASQRGGGIYLWKKSGGPSAKATIIPGAPTVNNTVIVAQDARQLIAFGSANIDSTGTVLNGALDPSLIRWCSAEDYTTWIAASTNTAGSIRLTSGSGIVSAGATRGGYFANTTTTAHLMYATGDANVYTTTALGKTTRPCSPLAQADYNGVTYIMCQDNFMIYDGVLRVLPCEVWNRVFGPVSNQNAYSPINQAQFAKVICHINREFSEVWWHYPSGSNTENDSYVVYNWLLNCWHAGFWSGNLGGDINRSAGHDFGDIFKAPYMMYYNTTTLTSQLFQHETGLLANGQGVFGEFIESYDTDIQNSGSLVHVSHLFPAMKDFTGNLSVVAPGLTLPASATVASLLNFEDGNGSLAFTDTGSSGAVWTVWGVAQETTTSKQWGTGSGSFLGTYAQTPNGLSIPTGAIDFYTGNPDWAIEGWFNVQTAPSNVVGIQVIFQGRANSDGKGPGQIYVQADGGPNTQTFIAWQPPSAGGMSGISGPLSLNSNWVNVWRHFALVRKGLQVSLYLDGVLQGMNTANTQSWCLAPSAGQIFTMGNGVDAFTPAQPGRSCFRGYIDGFRVTLGYGLYSGQSFTPPLSAPSTSNIAARGKIALLQHFDEGNSSVAFTDYALPANAFTNSGCTESTAQEAFGSGSLNVPGTANYIQTDNNVGGNCDISVSQDDWTVDMWIYRTSLPGSTLTFFDCSANHTCGFDLQLNSTGHVLVTAYPSGTPWFVGAITSTNVVPINTWTHIAVTRQGAPKVGGTELGQVFLFVAGTLTGPTSFNFSPNNVMASPPGANGKLMEGNSTNSQTLGFGGFIDEVRIIRGAALWTYSSFTPPTVQTPNPANQALSQLPVTVKVRKYQADAYKIKGPYNMVAATQKISARAKGRQIAIRVGPANPLPAGSGVSWAMGSWRIKLGQDGDR